MQTDKAMNVEMGWGRERRAPSTPFEARLYRHYIESALAQWNALPNWTGTAKLVTDQEPDQPGVWKLVITQRQAFDPATFMNTPYVVGYVWLADNGNSDPEPEVWHWFPTQTHISEQSNSTYPPVIEWEEVD